jgi:hypothetical protein
MIKYQPDVWEVIGRIMGLSVSVTDGELALLELVRDVGKGRTPSINVTENRVELAEAIERAVERDDARDEAAVARLEAMPRNARPA